jgi:adenylate cyclase
VLFAYVTAHLVNHALGLISIDAASAVTRWECAFGRLPGAVLLYGAAATH